MRQSSKRCSVKNNRLRIRDKSGPLLKIYSLLYKAYGPRHWWPAEDAFEVMVGAILTQNTNWTNVEKAIFNLKRERRLSSPALYRLDLKKLAGLIRPCGYYNIKAARLKNFLFYLFSRYAGKLSNLSRRPTDSLRREMLGVNGLGPETVDSIILYGLKKPVFVVDAYTRRIMACQGIIEADSSYDEIQSVFMKNLPRKTRFFNEYHALLVEHAKRTCRTKPKCQECILRPVQKPSLSRGGRG